MEEITNKELLLRIGRKLKEIRVAKAIKQKELAEMSGLSLFSICQIETGHNTSIQSIIQILRSLERLDLIDALIEESQEERQRVRRDEDTHIKNTVKYSLPEETEYAMAAEETPFNNK